jgi:hypothetical protein
MTDYLDYEELTAAVNQLSSVTSRGTDGEELAEAANFVLEFGAPGDFAPGEAELSEIQTTQGLPPGAAWSLIGHWSMVRNDPISQPPRSFDVHTETCGVCRFLEEIRETREAFDTEICETCRGGIDAHGVGLNEDDNPALYCVGQWERVEPEVVDMGRVSAETQVSDNAYATSWWAPLADGSFAVVTRTYFVSNNAGNVVLTRTDDYIVCTDYSQPSATELKSDWNLTTFDDDDDDPNFLDLHQLAVDSFPPDPGEWQIHGPQSDMFAIPVPA